MTKLVIGYCAALVIFLCVLVGAAKADTYESSNDYVMNKEEITALAPPFPFTLLKILDCEDSTYVSNRLLIKPGVLPAPVEQFVLMVGKIVRDMQETQELTLEQGYTILRSTLMEMEKEFEAALGYSAVLFEEGIFSKCANK